MTVYDPPVNTYIPIGTITLSSTSSEVAFSSIPATYRDLVLVIEGSTTASGVTLEFVFNSDTGANYTAVSMLGRNNGASSESYSGNNLLVLGNTFGTNPFSCILQIQDYNATDKHKTALFRNYSYDTSLSSYLVKAGAGRWASTSAVTSIKITSAYNSRQFAIGSTFSLYGIAS